VLARRLQVEKHRVLQAEGHQWLARYLRLVHRAWAQSQVLAGR